MKKRKFIFKEPCRDLILIRLEKEEIYTGDLVLEGSKMSFDEYHSVKAKVLKKGPEAEGSFEVGDLVLVRRYAGQNYDDILLTKEDTVKRESKDRSIYQVIRDLDVLATLEEIEDE